MSQFYTLVKVADHVRAELGDAVEVVLDGGPRRVSLEPTIVDATGPARLSA